MHVDVAHPANWPALGYLGAKPGEPPEVVPAASIPDGDLESAYFECGSHPDVVARVWQQLGAALPADGACLVNGHPCLVHPSAGVLLAVCMGTEYVLRVPAGRLAEALAAGCARVHDWGDGELTDLRAEFGPDWVFGCFAAEEPDWCRAACREFETGA